MANTTHLARSMQAVLLEEADALARSSGFVQRQRRFCGRSFLQTLFLCWLSGKEPSLGQMAQSAAVAGAIVSAQALAQRFTKECAAFLEQVLAYAVTRTVGGASVLSGVLARFSHVFVLDSTTVSLPAQLASQWPGCGGSTPESGLAAMKLEVMLDLVTGALCGPCPMQARSHDQRGALAQKDLPPGSLRLADLGYFSLDRFAALSAHGVDWLSRLKHGCSLWRADGAAVALRELLSRPLRLDCAICLGKDLLPCRLLAEPVPDEVAAERRRRLRRARQKAGRAPSKSALALCGWTVMVTSLPQEKLSFDEALVLYRARWQVELLFKLWKSEGGLDRSRSRKPERVLCEVYGKLICLLVAHWIVADALWKEPGRSLVKALHVVRQHALVLLLGLTCQQKLVQALERLGAALAHGCRVNKRKKQPSTFQRLQNPSLTLT